MANITFVGLNNLTENESSMIKDVASAELDKVSRHLKDVSFKLRVKTINPDGNARTYEFTAMLESAQGKFEASNSGWNLSVVLHELCQSLHNQAKKKLRLKE